MNPKVKFKNFFEKDMENCTKLYALLDDIF